MAGIVTAANVHDVTQLLNVVDKIPPVQGKRGRPRRRFCKLYADRAYDSRWHRLQLRLRGTIPRIAKRNTDNGSGLGKFRHVVENNFAHLHQFPKLLTRRERRGDLHQAMLDLGMIVICARHL